MSEFSSAIPARFKATVATSLGSLREIKASLDNVVACRGHGRTLQQFLVATSHAGCTPLAEVDRIAQRLAELAALAEAKGIDWDGFIASLGGQPDFTHYKQWFSDNQLLSAA